MPVHSVYQKPLPLETFPSLKISPKCVFGRGSAGLRGGKGMGKEGREWRGGQGEEGREGIGEEGEEAREGREEPSKQKDWLRRWIERRGRW